MVNLVNNISFIFAIFSGKMRSLHLFKADYLNSIWMCVYVLLRVHLIKWKWKRLFHIYCLISRKRWHHIPNRHNQQQEKDAHTLFSKSSGFIPIKWYVQMNIWILLQMKCITFAIKMRTMSKLEGSWMHVLWPDGRRIDSSFFSFGFYIFSSKWLIPRY